MCLCVCLYVWVLYVTPSVDWIVFNRLECMWSAFTHHSFPFVTCTYNIHFYIRSASHVAFPLSFACNRLFADIQTCNEKQLQHSIPFNICPSYGWESLACMFLWEQVFFSLAHSKTRSVVYPSSMFSIYSISINANESYYIRISILCAALDNRRPSKQASQTKQKNAFHHSIIYISTAINKWQCNNRWLYTMSLSTEHA